MLHELANLLPRYVADDLGSLFCPARQRFSQMKRLNRLNHRGQWRRVRIHNGLNQDRTRGGERLVEYGATAGGIVDHETSDAEGARHASEVDRLQIADIFGVPEKHHLLP